MAKKLIEWFFLNVLFALIPLILAMGFRWLADKPIVQAAENIPELAFTSVMLNIITIGDLGKTAETPVWDEVFRLAYYLMLFFAVISVAVLAAYLYGTIIGPENLSVTRHLLTASWCVTGACLVLTSLAEVAMNAVEKKSSPDKAAASAPTMKENDAASE